MELVYRFLHQRVDERLPGPPDLMCPWLVIAARDDVADPTYQPARCFNSRKCAGGRQKATELMFDHLSVTSAL
jgi:hypothetical protein